MFCESVGVGACLYRSTTGDTIAGGFRAMGRDGVIQALIGGCQQDMIGDMIFAMKPPIMLFPDGGPHVA